METTYQFALSLAKSELQKSDLSEVSRNAAVSFEDGVFTVPFLNQKLTVRVGAENVKLLDDHGEDIPTWLAIVTLHYLLTANGSDLAGELVDFRQLVGGEGYLPNFLKRAANRLARTFGSNAEGLRQAGLALGGELLDRGDVAFELRVFPRVPVTTIVWEADEEFPPSAKLLFDSTINDYLPTEDVVVVCQQLVTLLEAEV